MASLELNFGTIVSIECCIWCHVPYYTPQGINAALTVPGVLRLALTQRQRTALPELYAAGHLFSPSYSMQTRFASCITCASTGSVRLSTLDESMLFLANSYISLTLPELAHRYAQRG